MLPDFLRGLLTRCPPPARSLGLLREHLAIARRHAKVRAAWASHLADSRAAILTGADRCSRRQRVLVVGAGNCLDVPVAELAERFAEVILADIAVGPEARRWASRGRGRVRCVGWDATGALAALAAVRTTVTGRQAPDYFTRADPGSPPGGEPDLVVSANCISQFGLVPGHSLAAFAQDAGLPERCARAAARRHVAWLAERPGVRVLLADLARLDLAPDGRQLKRESLQERYGLRPPDRRWCWDLAPIPEWSREFHRVHEVGAWIDSP